MNGNEKIVIGVFNCPKYGFRVKGIRESWLKRVPANMKVFFVYGRPGNPASVERDIIYLDCPEAYEKLPEKTHRFLEFCLANFDFDYIFKTDDDSFIDFDRFLAFDLDSGDYIGQFKDNPLGEVGKTWHYGKCSDRSYEVPYEKEFVCGWATGGGYFLSRKGSEIAVEKTASRFSESLFEDMMIGEALTLDPRIKVVRTTFVDMGIINPLHAYDMKFIQDLLAERNALREEVRRIDERSTLLHSVLDWCKSKTSRRDNP